MKSKLKAQLQYVNASRKCRGEMANRILENTGSFRPLLEIAMETPSDTGSRACWIVEFTFKEKPGLLYPHLDFFTQNLKNLLLPSSIRPMARICELLTLSFYRGSGQRPPLIRQQREAITAACFDWLIHCEKVAPQAYSMQALVLLGQEFGWIHPELKAVVEQHYAKGSPAYKARARQVLKTLRENGVDV